MSAGGNAENYVTGSPCVMEENDRWLQQYVAAVSGDLRLGAVAGGASGGPAEAGLAGLGSKLLFETS